MAVRIYAVATDPAHRRNGYAKAALAKLLDHLERDGATLYELCASAGSAPLYEQLGFASDPALMRMTRLPAEEEGRPRQRRGRQPAPADPARPSGRPSRPAHRTAALPTVPALRSPGDEDFEARAGCRPRHRLGPDRPDAPYRGLATGPPHG
ncbi:GNAT family N-acetyltransferase [Streptomyces virginiae]|uniref:GNAT family N-acetyltransferase n=1 Tax=Streptomyces virginiae TaxID=1961 RepID=UPI0036E21892